MYIYHPLSAYSYYLNYELLLTLSEYVLERRPEEVYNKDIIKV